MQEEILEIKGQSFLIAAAVFIVVVFLLAMLFAEPKEYTETKNTLSVVEYSK